MDYSRFETETLKKMQDAACEKYKKETMKPDDGQGGEKSLPQLSKCRAWEKAKERYEAISEELGSRGE